MANSLNSRDRTSIEHAQYSDAYIESCFIAWYKSGRPTANTLLDMLKPDELGRIPSYNLVKSWQFKRQWDQKADVLDVEVQDQIQHQAIQQKVEMLNRHADAGKLMVQKAIDYIDTHELTKMPDAIRMLVQGVEIEQASRGLPSALIKISEMNDESLIETAKRLLNRMPADEAVQLVDDSPKNLPEGSKKKADDMVEGEFSDAD